MDESNKCCYSIPLKTGCFIIGYLQLAGILALIIFLMDLSRDTESVTSNRNMMQTHGTLATVIAILLVIFISAFVFCVILLVGLHLNKPSCLKAYLTHGVVFLVIYFLLFLCNVANATSGKQFVEDFRGNLSIMALYAYWLFVIRSYYTIMREEQSRNNVMPVPRV